MKRLYPLFRTLWFRVMVGIFLAYALFGFVGVPFLIRHYAPPAVSQAIQRPLSLGKVTFNPFLFKLEARDTALTESDGQPVFALRHLFVDFELARSLLNRAPTFAELRLEGPAVNLVQDRAGVLNMAKIAASLPPDDPAKAKPPEDAPLPSLIVQRIVLADGQVAFENQAVQPAVVNRAEHLGLELKNISTLPERHGLYEIEAALPEGGTLRWQGDVSLNPVKSSGKLDIEALKLATVLHLAGDRLALAAPGGDIGLSSRYQFSQTKTDTLLNVDEAVFKLTGLKLATADQQRALAELEEFRIGQVSLDLAQHTLGIPAITLRKGRVSLVRDDKGQLNWLSVLKSAPASSNPPPAKAPATAEPPGDPWKVNLGEFSIAELAIDYADTRPDHAVQATIGDFGLSLKAEATAGGAAAPVVHVGDFAMHFKRISLDQEQNALLKLDAISLGEASLDLPAQTVSVPRFSVGNGHISAAFDEAGQLNWLRLMPPDSGSAPQQTPEPAPASTPPATDGPPAPPWKVSLGQFSIAGIALDYADARAKPPMQAAIGDFGLSLKAEAAAGGADEPVVHVGDFAVHLKQISLNQAKNALLALQDISLEQASLDLPEQKVRVPLLAVSKGRVSASMNAAGLVDWQALAPPGPVDKKPTPPPPAPLDAAPARAWQVAVDQFKLNELALEYADASHKVPIKTTLGNFGLSLKADAVAGIGPLKATIQNVAVQMDRLAVNDTQSASALLKWDSFRLEDGRVDLEKQEATIRRLALKGGATGIVREASGAIYPASLFTTEDKAEVVRDAESVKKALTKTEPAADPWRFSLGELTISDFGIGVQDRSHPTAALAYDLDKLTVSVKDVSNGGKSPIRFDVRTRIRQGGALNLAGTAAPTGESAKASVKVERFNLAQLQPFIAEFAHLKLDSANLSTDLAVGFRQAKPRPEVRVTGGANLASLKLTQSKDGNKFLSWGDLTTQGIDFSLAPDKLAIKELKISEPDTVIAIRADKSSNISDVIKPQKPAPKPAAPAPTKPTKSPSTAAPAFPVSINRILIEKGKVDFSDASLILPFATRVHDFGGSIAGFSMTPKSRTTVQLTGRVDDYGETKVDASLSPMDIKQFSDINVIFRNVTMSSLSPYSATFAGRKIESGKLDLDLQYKIENSQLKSQNKITLSQFKLGETVESPNATSLPLDLAISLLTDNEGKIQASVPVEGRVDDPKFALGGVLWDAFTTLITNVATAPFNALASLVDSGDGGDPGTVAFDPGSAEIPPPEREKLQKLVGGLNGRPKLKLTVHGGYEPKTDAEALKSLAIRRAVADELDVTLAPGELPDAVNITDAASQRALDKLAKATGAADTVVTAYQREKGRQPQRAGLFGKPSETPEFYEMLLAALVEQAPLPPSALDALAAQRGKAVLAELVEKQKLASTRVAEGPPEAAKAMAEQRVAIRLELNTE